MRTEFASASWREWQDRFPPRCPHARQAGAEKRPKGFSSFCLRGTLSLTCRGNFSHCSDKILPSLHFSPHDGRSTRYDRQDFVALACRAQRTVQVRLRAKRLAPRPDGPLTHFPSPRGEKCRLETGWYDEGLQSQQPVITLAAELRRRQLENSHENFPGYGQPR